MKRAHLIPILFLLSSCANLSNDSLGFKRIQEKDYAGSINYLKLAIAEDPRDQLSLINLAVAYAGEGQYEKSLKIYIYLANNFSDCRIKMTSDSNDDKPMLSELIYRNIEQMKLSYSNPVGFEEFKKAMDTNVQKGSKERRCQ